MPRISLITATLNRAPLLREAIASVEAQSRDDFEHLIIDGGSTDGTLEALRGHPQLRVISEPDLGLYDAWNKGIRLATGEVVAFLNSDDLLAPGALAAVCAAWSDAVDLVSGGAEFFVDADGGSRRTVRRVVTREDVALNLRNAALGAPVINARFFRRTLFERVGPIDLRYRVAADRDWLIRLALAKPRETFLDRVVYQYREHAGSMTIQSRAPMESRFRAEHLAIAERALARTDLDPDAISIFRRWHREESVALAWRLCCERKPAEAVRAARRGWAMARDWPLAVVGAAFRRLRSRPHSALA